MHRGWSKGGRILEAVKGDLWTEEYLKIWNRRWNAVVKILKCIQLQSDQCIFFRWNENGDFVWIIIYVDDILLFTLRESLIINAKKELIAEFKMTDLRPVTVFMGARSHFLEEGLFLEQHEYSEQLLATLSMDKCNHTSTPMLP